MVMKLSASVRPTLGCSSVNSIMPGVAAEGGRRGEGGLVADLQAGLHVGRAGALDRGRSRRALARGRGPIAVGAQIDVRGVAVEDDRHLVAVAHLADDLAQRAADEIERRPAHRAGFVDHRDQVERLAAARSRRRCWRRSRGRRTAGRRAGSAAPPASPRSTRQKSCAQAAGRAGSDHARPSALRRSAIRGGACRHRRRPSGNGGRPGRRPGGRHAEPVTTIDYVVLAVLPRAGAGGAGALREGGRREGQERGGKRKQAKRTSHRTFPFFMRRGSCLIFGDLTIQPNALRRRR